MTKDQIIRGKFLLRLIQTTEKAIKDSENFTNLLPPANNKDDGMYNLVIFKHSDGSGAAMELNRYLGNLELMENIVKTLQEQLARYEKEFKEL